jgi:hypothetical protein
MAFTSCCKEIIDEEFHEEAIREFIDVPKPKELLDVLNQYELFLLLLGSFHKMNSGLFHLRLCSHTWLSPLASFSTSERDYR